MTVDACGPMLVEGPVEVVLDDGTTVRSDRFVVAVCACRRSRTYPWCDTSHRRRSRPAREPAAPPGTTSPAADAAPEVPPRTITDLRDGTRRPDGDRGEHGGAE